MMGKVAFCLAVVCICLFSLKNVSHAQAVVVNGWAYNISSSFISTYHVQVLSYDSLGRVATFSSILGAGTAIYSNPHYNGAGQLVYTVSSSIPSPGSYTATQIGQYECPVETAKAEFKASEQVVSANILRTERRAVEGMLYNHLRLIMLPGHLGRQAKATASIPTGVASGDAPLGGGVVWSLWLDGALTSSGNSRGGLQNAAFNAMGLLGAEGVYADKLIFGLTLGYSNLSTTYYNGSGANQYDNGFILNPYIGYMPVDNLLIAVQGGLILTDTTVTGQQTVAGMPLSHDANYGVTTASVGADVSYAIVRDRLVITPHAGYSYSSRQPQGGGVKGVEQGMLGAGAMIGYNFEKVTPFVSATYNYDTIGQTRLQREDMLGTAGLSFQPCERLQTTLSVSNTFFRYKEYETSFDLNLRYTF